MTGRREALIALLEHSLRRGHFKLVVRRWLMLQACGYDVPEPLRAPCDSALQRCRPAELARIREAVDRWAAMLTPRVPWWLEAGAALH